MSKICAFMGGKNPTQQFGGIYPQKKMSNKSFYLLSYNF